MGYLASSPPGERFSRVVDALKAILAEANAARTVRVFEPDEEGVYRSFCNSSSLSLAYEPG